MPRIPRSPEALATDLSDLPELDKSDEPDEVDVGSFELSLGEEVDDDDQRVDAYQVDIQELNDTGDNEAAAELDVGAELLDALPEAAQEHEAESPLTAPPAEDGELDGHLDAPLESDEPSAEVDLGDSGLEALPALNDEDGDSEAGPDHERAFLPSAPEGDVPDGPSYEPEWLLLGMTATALAPSPDGGAVAVAEHLMRFGHERQSFALPAGARATSLAELASGAVLLVTPRSLVEVSPSGALSLAELPELARGRGAEVVQISAAGDHSTCFARLANGSLLRRRGMSWEKHETFGEVRALAGSGDNVTLLVLGSGPTLQRSTDAGTSFHERPLPEPARTVALGHAPGCAASGSVVAVFDAERGLAVSDDGVANFRMVTGAVNVTAVAVGEVDGAASVFAALYREGRDASVLVLVNPSSGVAGRISDLTGAPDEDDTEETGRTSALLFVDGRLWAAGGYGLAKLSRAG